VQFWRVSIIRDGKRNSRSIILCYVHKVLVNIGLWPLWNSSDLCLEDRSKIKHNRTQEDEHDTRHCNRCLQWLLDRIQSCCAEADAHLVRQPVDRLEEKNLANKKEWIKQAATVLRSQQERQIRAYGEDITRRHTILKHHNRRQTTWNMISRMAIFMHRWRFGWPGRRQEGNFSMMGGLHLWEEELYLYKFWGTMAGILILSYSFLCWGLHSYTAPMWSISCCN